MKPKDRQFAALAMILVVSWLTHVPASAQAEDPYASNDEYQSGDFGRVTYQENGVTIHRAFADPGLPPVSEAGVNSPIYPGDALLTAEDQRVEVQVASGSLIRVDRATDVTFLSLPDPYAEFADNSVLQLAEGTLRITTRLTEGEEFRIDTPASSIYFLGDGDFRIEVTPGGRTEVISRRGVAEVVGNGGSILVQGGMRTEVFAGTLPEEAWAFNTFVTDNFDRWVDERDAIYRVRDRYPGAPEYSAETYDALPAEVQPYYQELSYHGDWTLDENYGHVWYPSAVPADWSPYHDGYWDYGPGGYFWVSYEPWGWAPYHYGRWNWVVGYGWCWAPGRVFSGAWVAWSWGSAHVGWAPIDYWGRPCSVRGIYYGYYDPHSWTFVDYAHVGHRNYQRHAVRVDDIGADIRHATVVTRAPRVSPTRLASSREARVRAMRMVEEDRAGRMRPVDRTSRPSLTMNDVERRMRGRSTAVGRETTASAGTAGRSRATARRGNAPSSGGTDRSTRGRQSGERAADRRASDGSTSTGRTSSPREGSYPSYSRRLSQDRSRGDKGERRTVGRRDPVPSRGDDSSTDARRTSPTPRVRPRDAERAGTDQRVRDLYRKAASPRSTRDGSPAPERRQTDSKPRPDQPRRTTRDDSAQRSQSSTRPRTKPRSAGDQRTAPSRSRDSGSGTKDKKRDDSRSQRPNTSARRSQSRTISPTRATRSTTRSSTSAGGSQRRSTGPSPKPSRTSSPRSTTRSPASGRSSGSRSTGRSSGSSGSSRSASSPSRTRPSRGKSTSSKSTKRSSSGKSSSRGKKK
jgi:hypothetical protein